MVLDLSPLILRALSQGGNDSVGFTESKTSRGVSGGGEEGGVLLHQRGSRLPIAGTLLLQIPKAARLTPSALRQRDRES